MFGKRKCDAAPVFREPVPAGTAELERTALAGLTCASGAEFAAGSVQPPRAAALVRAAQAGEALWLYGRRMECSRCKKVCDVTLSTPASGPAPNASAARSQARADVYALQHAFLPEWFLNVPAVAHTILTNKLEGWQAATMKQIRGIVEVSPGDPMPIRNAQLVATPGDTTAVLLDFITPQAPVEAHHALLVGGARPYYFLSEKTHLGEESPLQDMAGLTEWTFANPEKSDMKHTAIELLPEVSRSAFFDAAVDLLKRRLA